MSLESIPGYAEAMQALEANLSPRATHLATLERYIEGTQYEGLPDWFSDTKPLWERAPCIVDGIVKSAIKSNSDLLLGEGRFPALAGEDLDGDEAEAFERVLARIIQKSRLRMAAREAFEAGQGSGSACAVFGVRAGRLFIDTVRARWCEPEFDADGAVSRLEIRYPYFTIVKSVGGTRVVKAMFYRRVIDGMEDVTFKPVEARADGLEPAWEADKTVAHGLGFCPVVWYAHMRGCAIVGDIDGKAIHEQLLDEVRGHDFVLSQKHRAALYAGDPQWTEVGVQPGYNPTDPVPVADVPTTLLGGKPTEGNPVRGRFTTRPNRNKARKKSPGAVWQYPENVQVKLHTLPGEALDALDKHARDLRAKLSEGLGVVFLDPETLLAVSTLSGRALEALRSRQLDRCDSYRSDFGDRFLLPALGMLLRIALTKRLSMPSIDVVERVIARADEQWSWHQPPLALTWGRYFRLDADEEAKQVDSVVKARDGGLSTLRAAVKKLRGVLDIKDVDAYLVELEAERRKAATEQQSIAARLMQATQRPDDEPADDDDDEEVDDGDEEPDDARARPGASSGRRPRAA